MNPFTKHPNQMGETYWRHGWRAVSVALLLALVVPVLLVHAVFPFVLTHTGSKLLETAIIRLWRS